MDTTQKSKSYEADPLLDAVKGTSKDRTGLIAIVLFIVFVIVFFVVAYVWRAEIIANFPEGGVWSSWLAHGALMGALSAAMMVAAYAFRGTSKAMMALAIAGGVSLIAGLLYLWGVVTTPVSVLAYIPGVVMVVGAAVLVWYGMSKAVNTTLLYAGGGIAAILGLVSMWPVHTARSHVVAAV